MTNMRMANAGLRLVLIALLLETFATSGFLVAQESGKGASSPRAVPGIFKKDGRYALMVDGEPYLMLGVQANNSSAWPAYLDKVWPAAETLHANTVELPIYWEQLEPTEG
jgi:hypothetical protein